MEYVFGLFFGTFFLEDLALVSAIALIDEGKVTFFEGAMACFLGISIGDIGLYYLGFLASKNSKLQNSRFIQKYKQPIYEFKKSRLLSYSIVFSRLVPGTRLPTYLAAGFLSYSFSKFFILTILSVFVWVFGAMALGKSILQAFDIHWSLVILILLLLLKTSQDLVPLLLDPWSRKALVHSWRKWLDFEFWPGWFFYLPIVPVYTFFSLKYRNFFTPFYANPHIYNGGIIGESKWEFLKHLNPKDPSSLKFFKLPTGANAAQALENLTKHEINFPFIIKPDIGQRGYGVRIIRTPEALQDYLALSTSEIIVQELCSLKGEAGIFYIRDPNKEDGFIFSITDKFFPFVVGDGKTKLGDLILQDKRARIIAGVYFERHAQELNSVIPNGTQFALSECGNHCQGAVFINGNYLITKALEERVHNLALQIPDYYFGRFDIRYLDHAALQAGHFQVLEVNGAGSEATHIWDAKTTIFEAYGTLWKQWTWLFYIGHEMKKRTSVRKNFFISFFKESYRVYFRKEKLSVSS